MIKCGNLTYHALLASTLLLTGCGKDARVPIALSIGSGSAETATPKANRTEFEWDHDDGSGTEAGARRLVDDSIAIRVEFDEAALNFDQAISVILTNNTDQPLRIWNPEFGPGDDQFSFCFTNLSSREHFIARRRVDDKRDYRKERKVQLGTDFASIEAETASIEVVEIEQGDDITIPIELDWRWIGFPCPNSEDRFSFTVQFESLASEDTARQSVWTGTIESALIETAVIAPSLKIPHDYLRHGFPDKAIELMAADPRWITANDDSWWRPLHCAANYRHPSAVRWLLDHGADVNDIAPNDWTPLHLADNPEVIALILQKNPDWSWMRETPLQRVAAKFVEQDTAEEKEKWRKIIDLYLKSGVDYDLLTAIHLDDRDRVKEILLKSPQLANDYQRQSPLRTAAALGRLEICRYLIEQFHVDVDDFNRGTGYPIIKSALAFPAVVKLLIDSGADLNTRITWNGGREGRWTIDGDATALHEAVSHGVPETITLLIDSGVDIFAVARGRVETALELAAMIGKTDIVRAIVQNARFDAADGQRRQTLLDKSLRLAIRDPATEDEQLRELVRVLLDSGANQNANEDGRTLVQSVAGTSDVRGARRPKTVALLVQRGGTLDLVSAITIGDLDQVRRLLKLNPAPANLRCPDDRPALSIAVEMNYREIVAELLKAGVDVNIRNLSNNHGYAGETPLHCAVSCRRYEMVQLLLDAGADVNAEDDRKRTPLHEWGGIKVAQLLVERGARLDARNADGDTLLDWSRKAKWSDSAEVEKLYRRTAEKPQID